MNDPSTVREAMMAQLLGEMSVLLNRAEKFTGQFEQSSAALLEAAGQLLQTVEPVKADIEAMTDTAKRRTVEYVLRAAEQARRQSAEEQVNAMRQVARSLIAQEVTPAVRELTSHLRRMAEPPLSVWLLHIGIAVLGSLVSSLTVAAVLLRTLT